MIKFCPHCNQRYVISNDTTDYVHTCSSNNLTLDQEDVVVVGNYDDGNGVVGSKSPQEVLMQGVENQLQGKRPEIEDDERKHNLTRRGKIATTHRQRQHEEYINIGKEGLY
jgi:hypothetical protein